MSRIWSSVGSGRDDGMVVVVAGGLKVTWGASPCIVANRCGGAWSSCLGPPSLDEWAAPKPSGLVGLASPTLTVERGRAFSVVVVVSDIRIRNSEREK